MDQPRTTKNQKGNEDLLIAAVVHSAKHISKKTRSMKLSFRQSRVLEQKQRIFKEEPQDPKKTRAK
jgi:hypothetical protein